MVEWVFHRMRTMLWVIADGLGITMKSDSERVHLTILIIGLHKMSPSLCQWYWFYSKFAHWNHDWSFSHHMPFNPPLVSNVTTLAPFRSWIRSSADWATIARDLYVKEKSFLGTLHFNIINRYMGFAGYHYSTPYLNI